MYRKNEFSQCKNRAKWVGGLGRVDFSENRKTEKNFSKCLIFNGLLFFGSLFGGFSVAFRCRKSLSHNAFKNFWVLGLVLSKG